MLLYHGTHLARSEFGDMTTYTDSIVEAAAFAKLSCDEAGVSTENARIYVISTESWRSGDAISVNRGNHRHRFRFGRIVSEHNYSDLREILDANGWAMLHADTAYLKRFLGES